MSYERIQFGDLKELAMGRLGNTNFYQEDLEVPIYINEALRLWNVFTWQWKGRLVRFTVADQIYYDTSATLLKPMRVTYNDLPLDITSLFSLDNGSPGWQADTDTPESWFPVGLTQIGIHPADSAGSNSLIIEGVVNAPTLSSDTDYLDLGDWQVQAILDYVQHTASFKQGGQEFQATMELFKGFLAAAGIQNSKFRESAIYRMYMGQDADVNQRPIYKEAKSGNRSAGA